MYTEQLNLKETNVSLQVVDYIPREWNSRDKDGHVLYHNTM